MNKPDNNVPEALSVLDAVQYAIRYSVFTDNESAIPEAEFVYRADGCIH